MEEKDETMAFSKEIYEKIKIPKEEKEKIYSKLTKNFLIAIAVFFYVLFLNLGYVRLEERIFRRDLKVFAFGLILFTIWVFEKAYKKDSGTITIHGIEMLVLSFITLYMPYVYFYQNPIVQVFFETCSIYIALYYIIKCIFIYKREIKNFKLSLSDVKEITKEDDTYLDEKSEKKFSKKKGK
ncbi:MAG: hypothetical protein IKF52_04525 [Clostridia bacterium]|nr:hypothetical protein [Clostridia bacterium]